MKLFIISDLHGHFTVTKKALEEKGFEKGNKDHHLLCLGDYFDRGSENIAVYEFLTSLNDQASFILGNHDLFLLEFLEGDFSKADFNAVHNGFNKTLEDFSGMNYDPLKLDTIYKAIHKNYPDLLNWLKSMPLYIETDDYIFTHGGIDITLDDWRKQDKKSFVWNYQSSLKPHPTKTIVVGHERTKMIRLKRMEKSKNPYDIIYDDTVIHIDPFVEESKMMNVLVLNETIK